MIVLPTVLTAQLKAAPPALRKELALDFAGHVAGVCREALGSYDVLTAYLDAARAFLEGTGSIEQVAAAHWRFWKVLPAEGLAHEVAWTAVLAVRVACQRELAQAAGLADWRHIPQVTDVATSAQAAAGRYAASTAGTSSGDLEQTLVRRARWEEARWQLIRTIERAPNPN